jgi:hypothetical protein
MKESRWRGNFFILPLGVFGFLGSILAHKSSGIRGKADRDVGNVGYGLDYGATEGRLVGLRRTLWEYKGMVDQGKGSSGFSWRRRGSRSLCLTNIIAFGPAAFPVESYTVVTSVTDFLATISSVNKCAPPNFCQSLGFLQGRRRFVWPMIHTLSPPRLNSLKDTHTNTHT